VPGDIHLTGTFLLRAAHQINEPDGLVFVHGHPDGVPMVGGGVEGAEPAVIRKAADLPHFTGLGMALSPPDH
jgi:hypothetical protein